MWERACSRKRLFIQQRCWLTRRLREQARSHFCLVSDAISVNSTVPLVGVSLLAIAVNHSTEMLADRSPSRASSLPHWQLSSFGHLTDLFSRHFLRPYKVPALPCAFCSC